MGDDEKLTQLIVYTEWLKFDNSHSRKNEEQVISLLNISMGYFYFHSSKT
jgi:hypothetical protein